MGVHHCSMERMRLTHQSHSRLSSLCFREACLWLGVGLGGRGLHSSVSSLGFFKLKGDWKPARKAWYSASEAAMAMSAASLASYHFCQARRCFLSL